MLLVNRNSRWTFTNFQNIIYDLKVCNEGILIQKVNRPKCIIYGFALYFAKAQSHIIYLYVYKNNTA
jgi:hypothetical protein